MKQSPIWLCTLLALLVMNLQIYKKEQTLNTGQTVLLELAPVDPRSLMQGDYMRLRYALAREVKGELGSTGKLVVEIDPQGRGLFKRLADTTPPAANEQLLVYRNRDGIRLGAESFFFQEGQAKQYEKAKYGELRVDAKGQSVLVGLRDEALQPL